MIRSVILALAAMVLLVAPCFAQAVGHVQVKFVKAALVVGGGGGSGTLTYRGRHYRFIASGFSLGVTAGASVTWLEGTASGIKARQRFRRQLHAGRSRWRMGRGRRRGEPAK
ncbi:hypothetical protein [Bradyrhizobium elkanii]